MDSFSNEINFSEKETRLHNGYFHATKKIVKSFMKILRKGRKATENPFKKKFIKVINDEMRN